MNILLDVQGKLTPAASKSQIIYAFPVLEDVDGLTIKFSYAPKLLEDADRAQELIQLAAPRYMEEPQLSSYLERWEQVLPLQNLLTLSLDDPHGFRGAAHRHTSDQVHRIDNAAASPGFLPGPMNAGMWRITVSVHAVVTDHCTYELQVLGWKRGNADGPK